MLLLGDNVKKENDKKKMSLITGLSLIFLFPIKSFISYLNIIKSLLIGSIEDQDQIQAASSFP